MRPVLELFCNTGQEELPSLYRWFLSLRFQGALITVSPWASYSAVPKLPSLPADRPVVREMYRWVSGSTLHKPSILLQTPSLVLSVSEWKQLSMGEGEAPMNRHLFPDSMRRWDCWPVLSGISRCFKNAVKTSYTVKTHRLKSCRERALFAHTALLNGAPRPCFLRASLDSA